MAKPFEFPDFNAKLKRRKLAVVPNADDEDVSTKTCHVVSVVLCNNTAGALTFTMKQKKSGATTELFKDYSVGAKATVRFVFEDGVELVDGFDIQASGAGINAQICYFEAP